MYCSRNKWYKNILNHFLLISLIIYPLDYMFLFQSVQQEGLVQMQHVPRVRRLRRRRSDDAFLCQGRATLPDRSPAKRAAPPATAAALNWTRFPFLCLATLNSPRTAEQLIRGHQLWMNGRARELPRPPDWLALYSSDVTELPIRCKRGLRDGRLPLHRSY